ncbi:MAG: hypothetical protein M0Z35_18675, partial [Desulfitobacterium hafniense]|nr:hypothetical protein [Desulfitobacterium hafniense]
QMSRPWLTGGSVHPTSKDGLVSPEPRMAGGDPVHCPASGVGRLNGSLLFCVKTSRSCLTEGKAVRMA